MDTENNITVTRCSPSQLKRLCASREKGWSLNRNKKNTMKPNYDQSDVQCGQETRKDKEDNDIIPNISHESPVKAQAEKEPVAMGNEDNLNGNCSSQEAQEPDRNGFRSLTPLKTVPTISRSVSFAHRNKENSRELWERQESCLSLSSAGRDHMPWNSESSRPHSSLGHPSRNALMPGDGGWPSEGKVPVILRNKRELRQSSETASSTERIKRRSAEISRMRLALEEKVRAHQSRPSYMNSAYRSSWSDLPQSPHFIRPRSRPKSACGFSHMEDYYENENYPLSPLEHRNNNRNIPRWQNSCGPDGLASPHGMGSNTQRLYSPTNIQRDPGPVLCQRCSSPVRMGPQESFWSLCREGEDAPSRYHTPASSPAHRMPQIRTPGGSLKPKTAENKAQNTPVRMADGRINYYPNCDATIWIRSCTHEVTEPLSGLHLGEVPKWLRGALIRNGPGRIQVGEHQYNHVFDGSALLHRFHFKHGRVTYQNKFLQSRSYLNDTRAQRIVVNYFGTRAHPDPCKTILQNIASKFTLEEHFTDNAQISLYPYGDSLYALTETPFIYRIDPDTLNTHEKVDLTRHISIFTHTAHPHVDRDGTVYNLGQGAGPMGPRYYICKFPKPKTSSNGKVKSPFEQARVVGTVAARWLLNPCYMHSFAMTDNYWVIIEQPLVVSVAKILKVLVKQDALIDALQWWEKETKIHVVRRDTGRVTSTQYVTETFFFLHTINAYEDRGHIVLDIAAYKNAEMLHCMFVEALKNASYDPTYAQMFRGRPKRWVLPLQPDKDANTHTNLVTLPDTTCRGRWIKKGVVYVTPELLADIGCEVPRIYYEEYNGRYYQYFYAICSDVDHPKPGTLVKVDVVNKQHVEWSEDNVYPSEPIFVPAPFAKREDEGVVLSALLRARGLDREVCLLVLDAASFTELARVEFLSPGPVPKCLHGWFVPEGTLSVHQKEDKTSKTPENAAEDSPP
ncbi:carotenoid isomerooxygenase-like [Eriocheir sinensis]|uniref:carotenoid isomerooxygenase-like n=1 Tax=Eriocheir sinensis TaxID=95602 RepID=UPI0021C737B2|nr:carotenoid isomerooxygenase-like [Eriocheir sinensis]